jgi:WD40 repeat protein
MCMWNINLFSEKVSFKFFLPYPFQGKDSQELKGHTDGVNQLCFNPTNNDELVSASSDKTVKLWDTRRIFSFFFSSLSYH